ncbi:hypothetical protein GJAV_G00088130 [Gymnothorax javanicus]|nr:hypothetical protein GJAV_G00088130 [Gymnothorax javanicus]
MDLVDQDHLAKIAIDFYDPVEIESAKSRLYSVDQVSSSSRLIKRQGDKKDAKNVQDILAVLHKCKDLPMFCASNLSRIPPVDVNSIDLTSMLKEFCTMRKEFADIRRQLDHSSCKAPDTSSVAAAQEWPLISLEPTAPPRKPLKRPAYVRLPDSQATSASRPAEQPTHVKLLDVPSSSITLLRVPAKDNAQKHRVVDSEGYQVVDRSRKKKNMVLGMSQQASNLKVISVPKRPFSVFVTRLDPETSCEDITDYVRDFMKLSVKCEQLKSKYDSYASFKVSTSVNPSLLLEPGNWAAGLLVCRFYEKTIVEAKSQS